MLSYLCSARLLMNFEYWRLFSLIESETNPNLTQIKTLIVRQLACPFQCWLCFVALLVLSTPLWDWVKRDVGPALGLSNGGARLGTADHLHCLSHSCGRKFWRILNEFKLKDHEFTYYLLFKNLKCMFLVLFVNKLTKLAMVLSKACLKPCKSCV